MSYLEGGKMLRFQIQISLVLSLLFFGCETANMPHWDGEFWSSNHEKLAIERPQDTPPRIIYANDPRFSQGVWLSYDSVNCLYQQLILNCREWKDPAPTCQPVPGSRVEDALKQIQ